MFTWFFKFWKARELRSQSKFEFGLFRACKEIISSCRLELIESLAKSKARIAALKAEIESLQTEALKLNYVKDDYGYKTELIQPVFTENQARKYQYKRTWLWILMIGFIVGETALYWLISGLVVPGLGVEVQLLLSLFFALGVMMAIFNGVEHHFKYHYAKELWNQKKITDLQLKSANHWRIFGYVGLVLGFAFIIAAGLARVYFIEGSINPPQYSGQRLADWTEARKWISVLTMLFTVLLGVYLAKVKEEHFHYIPLLKVYAKWQSINTMISKHSISLKKEFDAIFTRIRSITEINHQLILDLVKIFGREVDDRDRELLNDYMNDISGRAKPVDETFFIKYERLIGYDKKLFEYAVISDDKVAAWLKEIESAKILVDDIKSATEESLNEEKSKVILSDEAESPDQERIGLNENQSQKAA